MTMTVSASGPAGIFISYRREDAAYPAGWLYDQLAAHFGEQRVFKDIDSIQLGDDFVEEINTAVGSCVAFLAVIGRRWLTVTSEDGKRRLDDSADFVRLEIEAALRREVRLIPVLVDHAVMPRVAELPPSLRPLRRRQALELRHDRFKSDISHLLEVLDVIVDQAAAHPAEVVSPAEGESVLRGERSRAASTAMRVGRQERADRDRARLPLGGARRTVVLGCARGAGQTVTALMTGQTLAAVRGTSVAGLDLNPGDTSLASRSVPVGSIAALLERHGPDDGTTARPEARFDVIAGPQPTDRFWPLADDQYRRLAVLLAERYPLTVIDPGPTGLSQVLSMAHQLVLVVPASPEGGSYLTNTWQWLTAHGYSELASQAVTVINGVSARRMEDVLRSEAMARGRCRAIVRVPWDELLATTQVPSALRQPTRHAYTALAGVLVAGMAAVQGPGESSGPGPPEASQTDSASGEQNITSG